ncbi:fimbrial chaperone [Escherichia coli]|uniref:Putative fimbrial assembly chaperone FanE n=1 Tax=Escherichia coli TaxID=562 RepID=A0A376L2R9_ECOLX|nr:fimbrial chaperone [Escherichia coli]ELO0115171.1 fimbrial chaperone [Escherichia coli O157]EFB2482972.1 fimbrial chaperone [Escherichia coli]EFC4412572.1 fimbrial chaperone [Escherichia coli]EFD0578599.1 fimbrial chaperone [Escherichia coli]EFD0944301.1 fimbrial chaperone [Escherichia coli]
MNKLVKQGIISLLAMSLCGNAMAAFVLNGTRFIYEEGKRNVSFEVTNNADETYGGQVWIDNSNQGSGVYMVPAPPFFKVGTKQKQIIRIIKTETPLPSDRESLFWLNVQEIPPKPKNTDGNVLSVAVNTRVKLIYRPESLIKERKDAEKKIELIHLGEDSFLSNPTPYYFAIVGISVNGQPLKLTDTEQNALAVLEPFGKACLGKRNVRGRISVEAVNDWGATETFDLQK